jgi:hypothetical protein
MGEIAGGFLLVETVSNLLYFEMCQRVRKDLQAVFSGPSARSCSPDELS